MRYVIEKGSKRSFGIKSTPMHDQNQSRNALQNFQRQLIHTFCRFKSFFHQFRKTLRQKWQFELHKYVWYDFDIIWNLHSLESDLKYGWFSFVRNRSFLRHILLCEPSRQMDKTYFDSFAVYRFSEFSNNIFVIMLQCHEDNYLHEITLEYVSLQSKFSFKLNNWYARAKKKLNINRFP